MSYQPKVRKIQLDFSDVGKYWFGGNPWVTYFSDSMNILFPAGERFFIRSVQAYADKINNPELKQRVKAFIGQEVQHGRVTEELFEVMRAQNIPIDDFLKFYQKTAYDVIEKVSDRIFGPKFALSVTVALEHYTATLADIFIKGNTHELLPDSIRMLFQWHAAEEIEHKSVAFDVLQEVDDSYALRIAGFLFSSVMLWLYASIGQIWFLLNDKELSFWDLFRSFPGQIMFVQRLIVDILPTLIEYFQPGFHPDQIDNYGIAEEFFAEYEKELLRSA